jgi:enoyl-CoA hydratase/carnithine racemase
MTGQVVRAVRECPFPVIAAVHGVAAGAGAVLALAADFRVADPTARFAFLFTRVGLSGGDMGAAYLLPRVVGLGHATRLLMLGEPVRAPEAERIGLISELTAELDMPLAAAVELDAATQALLMNGEDYAEFHAAFTEKRTPQWRGR